jgi:hypothetical protein
MKILRQIIAALVFAVLLWCAVGVVVYPDWWYRFIFESNYQDPGYWEQGNYIAFLNAFNYLFPIALTVFAVVALTRTSVPEILQSSASRFWTWITTQKGFTFVAFGLLAVFFIGIFTSGTRSATSRQIMDQLAKSQRDLKDILAKQKKPSEDPPLSDPTSFSYIDTQEVESLYGQNEPDLVPALVRKRIEFTEHLEGEASIEDYLKTKAGISQAKEEETELRETEKNPERKLRDLIRFLYDQGKLKRYGHQRWKSEDLQKLEDATALLSKYGVVADPRKLQSVRDQLLYEEVQRLDDELSVLHGLVLVEGDWTVEATQDSYGFRAPVVEQISKPLYFETRIRTTELTSKTQDIIGSLKARPIRLTVFGNVIAGASPGDRSVHIAPIAVF